MCANGSGIAEGGKEEISDSAVCVLPLLAIPCQRFGAVDKNKFGGYDIYTYLCRMENIKVKDLKRGYGVNHKQHGYIQYRGLATKHPYTDEPKVPHRYIFWSPVDEDGNTLPDVVLTNGNEIVELVDKYEEVE